MYPNKEYYENRIAELEAKVTELQEFIAQNVVSKSND